MFQLARARADELGAKVLWCDGGEGAVGGIAGGGERDMQVGEGTWVKIVGLDWPFDHSRTMYAVIGDMGAVFILWVLVMGGGNFVGASLSRDAPLRQTLKTATELLKDYIDEARGELNQRWRRWRDGPVLLDMEEDEPTSAANRAL